MKKKYAIPSMKVLKIENSAILAGSNEPGYDPTKSFDVEGNVGSKRGGLIFEDDDLDFEY